MRGNHDCYALDPYFEVNLTKRYPTWNMPALYHEKLFDLGHGKKLGVLFMDTCLAICANDTYEEERQYLNPEARRLLEEALPNVKEAKLLKDVKCGDDVATAMGN